MNTGDTIRALSPFDLGDDISVYMYIPAKKNSWYSKHIINHLASLITNAVDTLTNKDNRCTFKAEPIKLFNLPGAL